MDTSIAAGATSLVPVCMDCVGDKERLIIRVSVGAIPVPSTRLVFGLGAHALV